MAMFRSFADVVLKDDLRSYLTLPAIETGRRQIITAEPSPAFRWYQRVLAKRIKTIEARKGKPVKGMDILLSVITDGRHAAIDLRFVLNDFDNEPGNKLNALIANVHRIWSETSQQRYRRPDGEFYSIPGAAQMIFSDLGTMNVEAKRGFSAYRWIKDQLIARGVPAGQIAFMQDHKTSMAKQRLFGDINAGRIRVLLGSSETMGTGVNAAPPGCPLAAQPDRAARGPHRAAGQSARRDRHLCLCHAGLDRRHHVADQRAQTAFHQRGAVGRSLGAPDRRRRVAGEPVRDGQGHCVG